MSSTVTAPRPTSGVGTGVISTIIDSVLPLTNERAQCGDSGRENNFVFEALMIKLGGQS